MVNNITLGGYIVRFKKDNPKDNINEIRRNARRLDNISLENEIKTKKYYLSKAKIKNKYNASVLITIILACITISMAWVTFYGSITNNTIQASKIANEYREIIEENDRAKQVDEEDDKADEYEEQIKSIVDMLKNNISIGLRVIKVGGFYIFIAFALFIVDVWSGSREEKNIALLELELDILSDELKSRRENIKRILKENLLNTIDGIDLEQFRFFFYMQF